MLVFLLILLKILAGISRLATATRTRYVEYFTSFGGIWRLLKGAVVGYLQLLEFFDQLFAIVSILYSSSFMYTASFIHLIKCNFYPILFLAF